MNHFKLPGKQHSSLLFIVLVNLTFINCDGSSSSTSEEPSALRDMMVMSTLSGEMAGTEVAGMEMAGTEISGTEIAGTEAMDMETAGAEIGGIEAVDMEMAGEEMAGSEVAGIENAGSENIIASCEEQMNCLVSCEQSDFACRQRCLLDGRAIDQTTLETAKSCLDRSMCNNQVCALSSCLPELMACPHQQGTNNCNQTQTCLQSAQEISVALECAYSVDMMAQEQLTTWITCLREESCTELNCEACMLEQLCTAGMSYEIISCTGLLNCISECEADATCLNSCNDRTDPHALRLLDELITCMQDNMCGSDQTCIMTNCNSELLACATDQGNVAQPNIETCMDLNACLEACDDNDTACKNACVNQTPPDALALFNALGDCSEMYMCDQDVSCLSSNCQQELVACVSDM